ncbi:2'-5' RNA ligase family protein [Saccharothrix syringae]|uniref:RNA 2',3'-cyclic phosphodiesterase n=1 Tax=Saccharothrix syringae TaxID=103733 RepID=A0A5Q0H8V3_SACSY|nr:2'-5' RNA ligase family protein [Saccharothrix syringae]QFZ22641.1 RNA 2',3'-cyclic phosphodiesterase [Saccharothrix syringae]
MNLFTALFPPPEAVAELDGALDPLRRAHPRLRWADPARWHVTVRFFGPVDPDAHHAAHLADLAGVPAPTLRLAGSGHFRQVLWIGVEGPLAELGEAARVVDWHPHLTVARARRRDDELPLPAFTGREWTATEVALVRSGPPAGYTVLDRVPLSTPNG